MHDITLASRSLLVAWYCLLVAGYSPLLAGNSVSKFEEDFDMSALLEIVLGGVLLVLGRKLFWLFVAGVGFAVGMFITPLLLPDAPQGVTLAAAVALAVLGAVLAITMQKIAIGLVGFIAGGMIALWLLRTLGLDLGSIQWLVFIGGGILGALLLATLFDWGLILLSSLVGANLVLSGVGGLIALPEDFLPIIFLVVFGLGVLIQARLMKR
jgi:hypothetical protein